MVADNFTKLTRFSSHQKSFLQSYTETHFIFSIFMFMARPASIYVVSLWSIFNFQPRFHYHYWHKVIKNKLVLLLFWDDNLDEESL